MMYCGMRGQLPPELDTLRTSELKRAIREANLGRENAKIAERYFIDKIAMIDIGAEIGMDRSAISRRLKDITPRVAATVRKLPPS